MKFPVPQGAQFIDMVKAQARNVNWLLQQANQTQSAIQGLQPGSWSPISLQHGWNPLSGYIPAQARIMQNGMVQVIGHITGGTVSNGTVIGTLPAGYYNPIHAHTFNANAITGAATAAQAGTMATTATTLADLDSSPNSPAGGNPTPTSGSPGSSYSQSYLTALAGNVNTLSNYVTAFGTSFNNGNSLHNSGIGAVGSNAVSTPVNMNTPTITLDTSGNLTINNISTGVSQLSFSELIPLVT